VAPQNLASHLLMLVLVCLTFLKSLVQRCAIIQQKPQNHVKIPSFSTTMEFCPIFACFAVNSASRRILVLRCFASRRYVVLICLSLGMLVTGAPLYPSKTGLSTRAKEINYTPRTISVRPISSGKVDLRTRLSGGRALFRSIRDFIQDLSCLGVLAFFLPLAGLFTNKQKSITPPGRSPFGPFQVTKLISGSGLVGRAL